MNENPYRAPLSAETCQLETFVKRSPCYRTTPEHLLSFGGQLYIYTDNGELILTADSLSFVGKSRQPLVIPLDSIRDVRVCHYSRWAKPLRLDYIVVHHRIGELEETTLLTPTRTQFWPTFTWETNRIVAEWIDSLEAARSKHT